MAVEYYDLVTVGSEFQTVDLIVWQRYRVQAFGIVERMLDDNPHLAKLHRYGPFLPVGTQMRIPMDPDILAGAPQPNTIVMLWGSLRPGSTGVIPGTETGQTPILSGGTGLEEEAGP
jgi:phage tail protein X